MSGPLIGPLISEGTSDTTQVKMKSKVFPEGVKVKVKTRVFRRVSKVESLIVDEYLLM